MSENPHEDVIADDRGDKPAPALFVDTESEEDRRYFRMRQSATDRLTLDDLDHLNALTSTRPASRMAVFLFAALATLCGLAGAAPGAAAGLIPLAYGVIQFASPFLAAMFAALAGLLALRRGRASPTRHTHGGARRVVFAGTGKFHVNLGIYGLQLVYRQKFWRARWSAFNAADLFRSDLNGSGLPMVSLADIKDVSLETLLNSADTQNPVTETLIEEAARWAQTNSRICLPLRSDPEFAKQQKRDRRVRAFSAGEESECVILHKRWFDDGVEADINWPRFVAACVFMIQAKDPYWVEHLDGTEHARERDDET